MKEPPINVSKNHSYGMKPVQNPHSGQSRRQIPMANSSVVGASSQTPNSAGMFGSIRDKVINQSQNNLHNSSMAEIVPYQNQVSEVDDVAIFRH